MKFGYIIALISLTQALEIYGNFTNINFLNLTETNCTTVNGKKNCTNSTFSEYSTFYGVYEPFLMAFAGEIKVHLYYSNSSYYGKYYLPMVLYINKTFSSSIGQYNWTMAIDFNDINVGPYAFTDMYLGGRGIYTQYGAANVGRASYIYTEPWRYVNYSNVSWFGSIYYNGTNMTAI